MKFIDYIYDTDGCLCDRLYNYDDIQLQAVFSLPTANPKQTYRFTFIIEAYTLDGQFITNVSDDFQKSFYQIAGTTNAYSNIVSKRIPDVLCTHKCFRLKVTIKATYSISILTYTKIVFSMFTDCMSVDNCCVLIPKDGISFKTAQSETLPEMSFNVNETMHLIYTEQSDHQGSDKIDFVMDSEGNLIASGEYAFIESANFQIIDGNLTATDYE